MRHEAGEALGAIGTPTCVPPLQEHEHDAVLEVAETCQLALQRMQYLKDQPDATNEESPFFSVDPTPALPVSTPTEKLREMLLDENLRMFEVRPNQGPGGCSLARGKREAAMGGVIGRAGGLRIEKQLALKAVAAPTSPLVRFTAAVWSPVRAAEQGGQGGGGRPRGRVCIAERAAEARGGLCARPDAGPSEHRVPAERAQGRRGACYVSAVAGVMAAWECAGIPLGLSTSSLPPLVIQGPSRGC